MKNLVIENIKLSLSAIRSNLLRTILTILIIAFGIMALVGILTSIDAIKFWLNDNFMRMGANTISIRNRAMWSGGDHNARRFRRITYAEAQRFKKEFDFEAFTSVQTWATSSKLPSSP